MWEFGNSQVDGGMSGISVQLLIFSAFEGNVVSEFRDSGLDIRAGGRKMVKRSEGCLFGEEGTRAMALSGHALCRYRS